jgi:hypothetical protein
LVGATIFWFKTADCGQTRRCPFNGLITVVCSITWPEPTDGARLTPGVGIASLFLVYGVAALAFAVASGPLHQLANRVGGLPRR